MNLQKLREELVVAKKETLEYIEELKKELKHDEDLCQSYVCVKTLYTGPSALVLPINGQTASEAIDMLSDYNKNEMNDRKKTIIEHGKYIKAIEQVIYMIDSILDTAKQILKENNTDIDANK